ncbi:glycosyltransferase family 4 protein [Pedobacter yulinensis]|nr:glycosyltransferase family 1 protein [Pedobacter yulinensis]
MKDTNCGYFSFGKGLGDALISQNTQRFDLSFYLFKHTAHQFKGVDRTIYRSVLDNLLFRHRNDFEVVHLSDQTCRLHPAQLRAKKIMTVHDMNKVHLKFSKPGRIRAYLKKLGAKISKCDHIVAISQFVADDIKSYFPESAHKVQVIHNGADKLQPVPGHRPAFEPAAPFIFTIGRLTVQKGFHLLPALLQNNQYHLVISGIETPHKLKIQEMAARFSCQDRVHITGPVSDADKAWYYQHCSAFAFPSRAEGFGLPAIEAMHFGKPAFLARYTSLPEVGGDAAYYFDNFEPEHMHQVFTEGMNHFAATNGPARSKAQAARFSWERAAAAYLNLYESCLV